MIVTAPEQRGPAHRSLLYCIVVLLVFAPVFFQLDGRLFSDPRSLTAPRGAVTNLPIPISVMVCAFALAAMSHRWLRHPQTLVLLFSVPLMFLASTLAGSGDISWAKTKLLLFQFALPMAGFALGREFGRHEDSLTRTGKCLLIVAMVIVPAQLGSTWFRHETFVLSPDMFWIQVYGHLQYVPVILMAAYVIGVFAMWGRAETHPSVAAAALLFAPVMGLYVAASMSITAVLGLWMGLFLLSRMPPGRPRHLALTVCLATVGLSSVYVISATGKSPAFQAKFLGLKKTGDATTRAEPTGPQPARSEPVGSAPTRSAPEGSPRLLPNLSERIVYWDYFLAGSTSDLRSFLFGHAEQPDIRLYPSAHNYYLDFLYNFGFVALIPVVLVIAVTTRNGWRARTVIGHSPELIGLTFVTFFLLFADNGLRGGMRQPYSGIATFFLWGMLSARLEGIHARPLSSPVAALTPGLPHSTSLSTQPGDRSVLVRLHR